MLNTFIVHIGEESVSFYEFEKAARFWDQNTHMGKAPVGGIQVITKDSDDIVMRDGWLVHINERGSVYISPSWI